MFLWGFCDIMSETLLMASHQTISSSSRPIPLDLQMKASASLLLVFYILIYQLVFRRGLYPIVRQHFAGRRLKIVAATCSSQPIQIAFSRVHSLLLPFDQSF
ncbi:hypothetical protein RYX36_031254 [Vicia faba]